VSPKPVEFELDLLALTKGEPSTDAFAVNGTFLRKKSRDSPTVEMALPFRVGLFSFV